MKRFFSILVGTTLICFSFVILYSLIFPKEPESLPLVVPTKHALHIDIIQDVSASIGENGVEIPTAGLLQPYFDATDRDIQLRFHCIDDNSAQTPLTVMLPAFTAHSPSMPTLENKNIVERRALTHEYTAARKQFIIDSSTYFSKRTMHRIQFFRAVDSILSYYRAHLTQSSDVVTAVRVADDALFFDAFPNARHLILLNSDGEDSQARNITQLQHASELYIINASGKRHSSIESVITKRFVSLSDAITYSLTQ